MSKRVCQFIPDGHLTKRCASGSFDEHQELLLPCPSSATAAPPLSLTEMKGQVYARMREMTKENDELFVSGFVCWGDYDEVLEYVLSFQSWELLKWYLTKSVETRGSIGMVEQVWTFTPDMIKAFGEQHMDELHTFLITTCPAMLSVYLDLILENHASLSMAPADEVVRLLLEANLVPTTREEWQKGRLIFQGMKPKFYVENEVPMYSVAAARMLLDAGLWFAFKMEVAVSRAVQHMQWALAEDLLLALCQNAAEDEARLWICLPSMSDVDRSFPAQFASLLSAFSDWLCVETMDNVTKLLLESPPLLPLCECFGMYNKPTMAQAIFRMVKWNVRHSVVNIFNAALLVEACGGQFPQHILEWICAHFHAEDGQVLHYFGLYDHLELNATNAGEILLTLNEYGERSPEYLATVHQLTGQLPSSGLCCAAIELLSSRTIKWLVSKGVIHDYYTDDYDLGYDYDSDE